MFSVSDLIATVVIEDQLLRLSRDPELLEFILCGYARHPLLLEKVGPQYIKQAIEFIRNNRVRVTPYYQNTNAESPSIVIVASGSETGKYIGDQAITIDAPAGAQFRATPKVIKSWDATSYDENMLTVSAELKLENFLWPGILITNGSFETKLDGIQSNVLCLIDDIPANTSLKGWKAQVGGSNRFYDLSASTDDVHIQILLTSHGESSVHRLLSIVLRHILKSSRLIFDNLGLQDVSVSWQAMAVTNQEELEYQSVYSLEGKYTDHWIARTGQSCPDGTNVTVGATATNPDPKKGDVKL